ncbi:MAG: cytochrome c biogenesis protein CcdA [Chloroflexota bacterium]
MLVAHCATSVLVAVVAGMFSFFSPCVFPLVPGYVAYIAGTTTREMAGSGAGRWRVALHTVFFVAGFAAIFVIYGASASALGQLLTHHRETLSKIAGAIIILFGLQIAGIVRIPWLYREMRWEVGKDAGASYLRSTLIGLAFGAGWTPCVGLLLGSILTLAAATTTLQGGVALLAAYSLGLGVPFLITGLLVGSASRGVRAMRGLIRPLNLISAALLVVVGVLMVSGFLAHLALLVPAVDVPFAAALDHSCGG